MKSNHLLINILFETIDSLPTHHMPCGLEVPPIGLGSYDDRKKSEQQKLIMWLNGIESGYRLLDTAYEYENEKHLGLAVKQLINTSFCRSSMSSSSSLLSKLISNEMLSISIQIFI